MKPQLMKTIPFALFVLLACFVPAQASVNVTTPASGSEVESTFVLYAGASPCSGQAISAMGYSFDNSSNTTIINGNWIGASVTGPLGSHVLHVKSWGNQGASCTSDVELNVVSGPAVPSNAVLVKNIHLLTSWTGEYDNVTSGSATGSTVINNQTTLAGTLSRLFQMWFTNYGGERFHTTFGADPNASNFLYDTWVYVASPSGGIANLEFDMNQVTANGQTVIYGVQCDGYSNTWDYTKNAGTPSNPVDTWIHSYASCNPRNWLQNAWHHLQISYSRDGSGNVTYKSIWLDGVEQDINATVPSSFALNWGSVLLTNFQVDGLGSYGGATAYLDQLNVSRW
jgi:hypothetical protein